MIKKISLSFILLFMCFGCSTFNSKSRIPQGNTGKGQQTDTVKNKVYGTMEGRIILPPKPLLDESGDPYPPQTIRIDGLDAQIPAGATGEFTLSATGKSSTDSFTSIMSTWKIDSAPVQLFIFGGIILVVGIILIFCGLWAIGVGASVGGFALIACGVMINQYPWVILVVIGLCVIGAGYYLYIEFGKKKLVGENQDTGFVLNELVDVLADVPNDILEEYVSKPLREHDQSSLIRKITKRAKFRI